MTDLPGKQVMLRKPLRRGFARLLVALMVVFFSGPLALLQGAEAPEVAAGNGSVVAPALSGAQETVSLVSAIFKVIGSLGLVLLLLLLFLLLIKKYGMGRLAARSNSLIKVVSTRMIGAKKYVTLLEVGGEFFLVGVTEQQINLLARLQGSKELQELADAGLDSSPPAAASFISLLNRARGRQDTDLNA